MMAFVQSMEFGTDRREELLELAEGWRVDAVDNGTAQPATMEEDRAAPGHFVMSVRFESAASASENSSRPETAVFAVQFGALCCEGPDVSRVRHRRRLRHVGITDRTALAPAVGHVCREPAPQVARHLRPR